MGVFQDSNRRRNRLRSLEKRCSVSIANVPSPSIKPAKLENSLGSEIRNHSSRPFRLPALDDASHSGESVNVSPQPHPHDEKSSLETRLNSKHSKNNDSDELAVDLDKSLDYGESVRPCPLFESVLFLRKIFYL
jgi:hypothetical protein